MLISPKAETRPRLLIFHFRIDRYTAASDPSRKLSMSNLKPNHPFSANLTAPGSPTAQSMQTNPSATNPLNHSEYFHSRNAQNGNFQLPGPAAAHHHYIPNAQAARISQSPSMVSLPGHKHIRTSSMVGHGSPAGGPAPTSIPPDMAPMPMSSLDASEPRLFPGIVSKSRKGSMVTSRSGLDVGSDDNNVVPEHMTQSLPAIALGKPRPSDDDTAIVEDEDEVGETA